MCGRCKLYREYNEDGQLIKLECSSCGRVKSVNCFHKNKNGKDGYTTLCSMCKNEYDKIRRINKGIEVWGEENYTENMMKMGNLSN